MAKRELDEQAAEKLCFLKGAAFRPYVKCHAMNPALAAEDAFRAKQHFFRSLFGP
jgi:hypothetical protein